MKAERRHTASALPECLEESAELALRALERVLPRANRLRGSSCAHWHTRHSAHCVCDRVGDREREGGAATHRVSSARVFGGTRAWVDPRAGIDDSQPHYPSRDHSSLTVAPTTAITIELVGVKVAVSAFAISSRMKHFRLDGSATGKAGDWRQIDLAATPTCYRTRNRACYRTRNRDISRYKVSSPAASAVHVQFLRLTKTDAEKPRAATGALGAFRFESVAEKSDPFEVSDVEVFGEVRVLE